MLPAEGRSAKPINSTRAPFGRTTAHGGPSIRLAAGFAAAAAEPPGPAAKPTNLFVPGHRMDLMQPEDLAALGTAIRYSARGIEQREFRFALVDDPLMRLIPGREQILMDGQNFQIPPNSRTPMGCEASPKLDLPSLRPLLLPSTSCRLPLPFPFALCHRPPPSPLAPI